MKLLLLLFMVATLPSCGKNKTGSSEQVIQTEQYQGREVEYALNAAEVIELCKRASRQGYLWDYDGTRWFNHAGQYLITTEVIDERTFKLKHEDQP